MFGLGPSELLIVLVLVLFFYGGKRLPQIGDGLGRGIREFKRAIKGTEGSDGNSKPSVTRPPDENARLRDSSRDDPDSGENTGHQS